MMSDVDNRNTGVRNNSAQPEDEFTTTDSTTPVPNFRRGKCCSVINLALFLLLLLMKFNIYSVYFHF